MADTLLDTNVIIDFLRGDPHTTEVLQRLVESGDVLHSCEITIAETFSGMRDEEKEETESFLKTLRYVSMSEEEAREGGNFRRIYRKKGKQLTLADALIGSLAISQNLILLTHNTKDYPMAELRKEKP